MLGVLVAIVAILLIAMLAFGAFGIRDGGGGNSAPYAPMNWHSAYEALIFV